MASKRTRINPTKMWTETDPITDRVEWCDRHKDNFPNRPPTLVMVLDYRDYLALKRAAKANTRKAVRRK